MQFQTMSQLGDTLKGIIHISKGSVQILNPARVRGPLIDRLVWTASFHEKGEMRGTARWIIKMAAPHLGIRFHSTQSLYGALRERKGKQILVPRISLKGMAYDTARAIFRVAVQKEVGIFMFEWPQPEQGGTYSSPSQYASVIAAAGIQERFTGPLFIDTSRQEQCRKEADFHLSGESSEQIYNRFSRAAKVNRLKNRNRKVELISLEKCLWDLPSDMQASVCSKMADSFASLCVRLDLVETKEAIKALLQPTESFFSIRDEINAAGAE